MTGAALITGVTGQDGFYLASDLVAHGVRVVGTTRRLDGATARLGPELAGRIELVDWDLVDRDRFGGFLRDYRPAEVYNLAAFTSGEFMDRNPESMTDTNGVAVLRMLDTIREVDPAIRFCQASTSEVFGASVVSPQNEDSPRITRSVYGAAKLFADNLVQVFRKKYGLFACSAVLFNHESPRRGEGFVTQKIVKAAVRIKLCKQDKLPLGNLSAVRDWGFAGDFMRAMRLMLAADAPRDYVLATGEAHTVAELCELAFGLLGLDYHDHVEVDPTFFRPTEAVAIVGDAARARAELNWAPTVSFEQLVRMMIDQALLTVAEEGA